MIPGYRDRWTKTSPSTSYMLTSPDTGADMRGEKDV